MSKDGIDYQYDYLVTSLAGYIQQIKDGISEDNLPKAKEAWDELEWWQKVALWKAPSKGGVFTTYEREAMKSTEFRLANWIPDDE